VMRDGLAAGDRVQLDINNGRNKAYIRNGLDWIKRFPVGRLAASCPGRVKSACGRYCSLIPGLGVKLSNDRPCRAHCSLRGRGRPSA
jgi:hypothetical protein